MIRHGLIVFGVDLSELYLTNTILLLLILLRNVAKSPRNVKQAHKSLLDYIINDAQRKSNNSSSSSLSLL